MNTEFDENNQLQKKFFYIIPIFLKNISIFLFIKLNFKYYLQWLPKTICILYVYGKKSAFT